MSENKTTEEFYRRQTVKELKTIRQYIGWALLLLFLLVLLSTCQYLL